MKWPANADNFIPLNLSCQSSEIIIVAVVFIVIVVVVIIIIINIMKASISSVTSNV
jgi:hypothetical protein